MKAWKSKLSEEDIWKLILFERTAWGKDDVDKKSWVDAAAPAFPAQLLLPGTGGR
jgi:hypothetical protein